MQEFPDENFKSNENDRLQVGRNTVGKGEIARYEQFLLFLQCFQKTCVADTQKPEPVWKMVKEKPPTDTFVDFCISPFIHDLPVITVLYSAKYGCLEYVRL